MKVLILITTIFCLSSCNLFKNTAKHKTKQSIEVSIKKDSVESKTETTKGTVESKEVDNGVIVTETEEVTVTKKEGVKTKVNLKKDELKVGENTLKDSLGREVIVFLDSLKNILSIEVNSPDEETTTTKKQKTVEHKNSSKDEKKESTHVLQKQVAVSNQEDKDINNIQTYSESKSDLVGTLMFWIGLAICIVLIVVGVKKFVFK